MRKPLIVHNRNSEYYFKEDCFITELWNSDLDDDVSVAKVRVKAGVTTRFHRLDNTVERYIILEGKGMVEIGDERPCEITAGDVVIIPSQTLQRIANTGETDLVFLAVCTPRFVKVAYRDA